MIFNKAGFVHSIKNNNNNLRDGESSYEDKKYVLPILKKIRKPDKKD